MSTGVLDPADFRQVLGHHPTGVALISSVTAEGTPVGMIVGTFTSVSLDPPLVGFLPTRDSTSFAEIAKVGKFTVNILAHDQEPLCRALSRPAATKFDGVEWSPSGNGSPLLPGVVGSIDCTLESTTPAGDPIDDPMDTVTALLLDGLPAEPDDNYFVAIGRALSDRRARDLALVPLLGPLRDATEVLLTRLTRELPGVYRAEPLALVAVAAYLRGDGALADTAARGALQACPGHSLATLMQHTIGVAVPPDELREEFAHALQG